jgi:hypothetical protein
MKRFEADLVEIKWLLKNPGHADQSVHGNRYKIIAGKPKKIHIGGTTGTLNYDEHGDPLNYGPEPPPVKPKKEPKPKVPKEPKPKKEPIPKPAKELNSDPSEMDAKTLIGKSKTLSLQTTKWKKTLEYHEQSSITAYTGSSYHQMNDALRNDTVESSYYESNIKSAQAGLLKGSLKKPVTVYRGMYASGDNLKKIISMMNVGVGQTFTDKAFVSTSINDGKTFHGNVKLKIVLPEGTKGAYVKPISTHPDEYEYLLPHSTKFKVLSHEVKKNTWSGDDSHTFTLQAMPTEYKSFDGFLVREIKHLPGQHDQSTHGNRFRTIAGKPKKVHIGGTSGVLNYDEHGNPLVHGPELPPKKEPKTPKVQKEPKPKKEPKAPKPPKELNSDPSEMDAKTIAQKKAYLSKQTTKWEATLKPEELKSIQNYTSSGFIYMNTALREDNVEGHSYESKINDAQSGLLKGSLKKPMTVYRGMNASGNNLQKILDTMDVGVGQTFTDKAFVSTSIDKNSAFGGNIKMHIILPEGTKGAYVDPVSSVPGEREYILPHHTKFKVISHKVDNYFGDPRHTFTLQAMPTDYEQKFIDGFLIRERKHGHHDQSTHGNRYRTIAGKPKLTHIGGTTGTLNYDHEGNPLHYGPEPPPKK